MTQTRSVEIFFQGPNGPFLLLRYAPVGVSSSKSYGEFVRISADDMESDGLRIILEHLKNSTRYNPKERSELDRMYGTQAYDQFHQKHMSVGIELLSDGLLEILPVHRTERPGGGAEKEGEQIRCDPSKGQGAFNKALKNALAQCS